MCQIGGRRARGLRVGCASPEEAGAVLGKDCADARCVKRDTELVPSACRQLCGQGVGGGAKCLKNRKTGLLRHFCPIRRVVGAGCPHPLLTGMWISCGVRGQGLDPSAETALLRIYCTVGWGCLCFAHRVSTACPQPRSPRSCRGRSAPSCTTCPRRKQESLWVSCGWARQLAEGQEKTASCAIFAQRPGKPNAGV